MKSHLELMHPNVTDIKPKKPRKRKIESSNDDKMPLISKDSVGIQELNENDQLSLDMKQDEEIQNEEKIVEGSQKDFISKYFEKTKGDTLLEGWKFTCNLCSYQILFKNNQRISMKTLKKHLLDEHQLWQLKKGPKNIEFWKHFKEIPDQKFLVDCKICSKQVSRQSMIRHLLNHDILPNEPSPCSICGKIFKNYLCLRDHEKFHRMERKYACQHCDMKFRYPDKLKRHIRVHTREKPYQCNECGRQFAQASQLKTHSNVHSGEKPYECEKCYKKFKSRSSKNSHKCKG